jgi:hypothetical protein
LAAGLSGDWLVFLYGVFYECQRGLTMRSSEPGVSIAVAIHASRGPGR